MGSAVSRTQWLQAGITAATGAAGPPSPAPSTQVTSEASDANASLAEKPLVKNTPSPAAASKLEAATPTPTPDGKSAPGAGAGTGGSDGPGDSAATPKVPPLDGAGWTCKSHKLGVHDIFLAYRVRMHACGFLAGLPSMINSGVMRVPVVDLAMSACLCFCCILRSADLLWT